MTTPPPVAAGPAPVSPSNHVTGRLWLHESGGVRLGTGTVWGFAQTDRGGHTTGPLPVDSSGAFQIAVPADGFIHLYAGAFQPCVVRVAAGAPMPDTVDIHLVMDPARLGANLPPELLQATTTLSGTVFETLDDGRRVPLDRVRVELDGLLGMGVVIATTMTDAEGRFVLCGVGNEREPYLFAARAGYRMFGGPVRIDGNTILDIEMQH